MRPLIIFDTSLRLRLIQMFSFIRRHCRHSCRYAAFAAAASIFDFDTMPSSIFCSQRHCRYAATDVSIFAMMERELMNSRTPCFFAYAIIFDAFAAFRFCCCL